MSKLTRRGVKKLSGLPALAALNGTHQTPDAADAAFRALLDEASTLGVDILAADERSLASGTRERKHDLHVAGTEDELYTDSVLVEQMYDHEDGRREVTAYFS
jgi:hypothetical protein